MCIGTSALNNDLSFLLVKASYPESLASEALEESIDRHRGSCHVAPACACGVKTGLDQRYRRLDLYP